MKKTLWLLFAGLLGAAAVNAQAPAPEPDTLSNPVQQGDPAVRILPPQLEDYMQDMDRVMPAELPAPVRETLEASAQYEGWEKAKIFTDKSKEKYLVQFREGDKTITYRFSRDGKPVWED